MNLRVAFGEVVARGLHRMGRRRTTHEGAVTQFVARPPEVAQVAAQRTVDRVAQGDLSRTDDGVDGTTDVGVPEVDAHQLDVGGRLEYVLVAVDPLVADKLINQGGRYWSVLGILFLLSMTWPGRPQTGSD